MDVRFTYPTTLTAALSAAAAGSRPVAGGTDLVVGTRQGKWSLPESLVALDRIAELRGIARTADGLRIGNAQPPFPVNVGIGTLTGRDLHIAGDGHAARQDLGGSIANASPAARQERSAALFRRPGQAPLAAGDRRIALRRVQRSRPVTIIGRADRRHRAAEIDGAGSCYVRLEFRRQMEVAVVGATAVVARGRRVHRRPDRHHCPRADGPADRRRRGSLVGTDGGPEARRRRAGSRRGGDADLGRPFLARAIAGRWRPVVVRRAVTGAIARARRAVEIPASASTFGR